MGALGGSEVVIIVLILLLLFGAKRLPELAKGLGKSIKEFKKATTDIQDEIENSGKFNDKINYNNTVNSNTQDNSKPNQEKDTKQG